jgi:hypothetical protein
MRKLEFEGFVAGEIACGFEFFGEESELGGKVGVIINFCLVGEVPR